MNTTTRTAEQTLASNDYRIYWRNVNNLQQAAEVVHDGHEVILCEDPRPLDEDAPDENNDGAVVRCTGCGTHFLAFVEELS